jgi:hypothetical protein
MQYFCLYLARFPYIMMENFQLWGVFESSFSEAVIGLLAWQILEDAVSHFIDLHNQRQVK